MAFSKLAKKQLVIGYYVFFERKLALRAKKVIFFFLGDGVGAVGAALAFEAEVA